MATLEVFAVYDVTVKAYAKPHFYQTIAQARRAWIDAANQEGSDINKHSSDFALFHLGHYDEDSGTFTNLTAPESLGLAETHKKVV